MKRHLILGLLLAAATAGSHAAETQSLAAPPIASERDPGVTPARGLANHNTVNTDDYPAWANFLEDQGRTVLRVVVRVDGTVGEAEVVQSSGSAQLDRRAIEIAQQRFRYQPAMKDGRPIAVWHLVAVDWSLIDAPSERALFAKYIGTLPTGELPSGSWVPDADNRVSVADLPPSYRRIDATVRLRVRLRDDGSVASARSLHADGVPLELARTAAAMVQRRFRYPADVVAQRDSDGWVYTTVSYRAKDRPYPFPLPAICRDAPHGAAPTRFRGEDGDPVTPAQYVINEDGRLGTALEWRDRRWVPVGSLANSFNEQHRFMIPRRNGVPAKCWFDYDLPSVD